MPSNGSGKQGKRHVGKSGTWLLRVFARDDLWDFEPLEHFTRTVRAVDPEATGKPFGTVEGLKAMKDGLKRAGLYASAELTNLDGQVDIRDLFALASNWQSSNGIWSGGEHGFYIVAVSLGQIGEVTLQAFQRRHRRVVQDACRMLSLVSDIPGERSRGKVLFAVEVVIERALGQIRRLQNVR